jgi:hypothetical protein
LFQQLLLILALKPIQDIVSHEPFSIRNNAVNALASITKTKDAMQVMRHDNITIHEMPFLLQNVEPGIDHVVAVCLLEKIQPLATGKRDEECPEGIWYLSSYWHGAISILSLLTDGENHVRQMVIFFKKTHRPFQETVLRKESRS